MAEAALNALKKLEANKTCVNCDAYAKFGFQNVCEKFKTFVCSNCKSAHQSYSQRVKSVSMSNWTMDEVNALREENGGGNAAARRVWLATWDESRMRKPNEKDHVDYFKKFINKVYNEKAFYDEDSASSAPATTAANLLDFGSPTAATQPPAPFDAFSGGGDWSAGGSGAGSGAGSPASDWGQFASAPAPSAAAPVASSGGAFFADFSSAPAPAADSSNDAFGAFSAAPAAVSDGFGAFASAPAPAAVAAPGAVFDPFAPGPTPSRPTPGNFDPFASTPSALTPGPSTGASTSMAAQWGMSGGTQHVAAAPARSGDFSAFDALSGPALGHQAPMRQPLGFGPSGTGMVNSMGMNPMGMNPMGVNPMGMNPMGVNHGGMGMGQVGPTGGYGHAMGAMASRSAPVSSGAYSAPRRPAQGSGARDPFAGLGLPQ